MKILVQKFGGTSVKDDESRAAAEKHIVQAVKDGYVGPTDVEQHIQKMRAQQSLSGGLKNK